METSLNEATVARTPESPESHSPNEELIEMPSLTDYEAYSDCQTQTESNIHTDEDQFKSTSTQTKPLDTFQEILDVTNTATSSTNHGIYHLLQDETTIAPPNLVSQLLEENRSLSESMCCLVLWNLCNLWHLFFIIKCINALSHKMCVSLFRNYKEMCSNVANNHLHNN